MTSEIFLEDFLLECRKEDQFLENCFIFLEASFREFNTNKKEAELKVIKESGTYEDYVYLEDAASEGLVVKVKNGIQKVIESIIAFIKTIYGKASEYLTKLKESAEFKLMEKKVNSNPEIRNKKVTIPDTKKMDDTKKEIDGGIKKLFSKIKSGKEVSEGEIQKTFKDLDTKWKAAIAATTVVSLGAAIMILKKNDMKAEAAQASAEFSKECADMSKFVEENTELAKSIEHAYKEAAKINKMMNQDMVRQKVYGVMKAIKDVLSGKGKEEPLPNPLELDDYRTRVYGEASNDMLDRLIDSSYRELENSTFESYMDAEDKLDIIENLLSE